MSQYVAILEDAGPDRAVGVWFPDLPGCFPAGETLDEAIANASQAVALYADSLEEQGKPMPLPRSLSALKADPAFLADLQGNMVALIAAAARVQSAAE
jgi:predicted RNase H-like HicB family nuclease